MSCKHSNKAGRAAAQGWWELVAAGEPFRLLFPVGALIGILGALMWPAHVWHVLPAYPGQWHARVMIEGFLTAFVLGFLGTALPRLLGVPRIGAGESLTFAVGLAVVAMLHASGLTLIGDQLFFLLLALFVVLLGGRAVMFRKDVPPPAFVLVLMGIACALLGSAGLILWQLIPDSLPAWAMPLSKLFLYQGYLLFPIMGIGAFLLPRFFGLPNRQNFPESLSLPPGWLGRAAFAFTCGLVVLAGFILEAVGEPGWGNGLRAAAVVVYFLREVPVHKGTLGGGSLALGLRFALFSIPLGYAAMAFWPERSFSLLHILFISGFSLITFIVASRVVLGHSGQSEKFRATLPSILWMIGLVLLAMLTRVSADWMPDIRLTHYAYAALSWVLGVAIWMWRILPAVRVADAEN